MWHLGTWFHDGLGRAGSAVGQDYFKAHFQSKPFYGFIISLWSCSYINTSWWMGMWVRVLLNIELSLYNLMDHREMTESKICDKSVWAFIRPQNYSLVVIYWMKMPYRSSVAFKITLYTSQRTPLSLNLSLRIFLYIYLRFWKY